MRHKHTHIDYLYVSPFKALIAICFPLIGVNIVLAVTALLTNELYSRFVGEHVFSIMGYLSTVTTSFGSIISGIMFAAWIKTAHHFSFNNKSICTQQILHGIVAIFLVEASLTLLLLLFADPILHLLSIPLDLYQDAKLYYILTILLYLPVQLAGFCLTIVNGTSSAIRLFWVNIFVVCSNAIVAVIMLAVLRCGMIGVALMPVISAIVQLVFYFFLFRADGYHLNLFETLHSLDWSKIGSIIRYGLLIALQSLLCTSGYLIVTYQANRYLPMEYISVLNITLPLAGIISAVSSATLAFCPPNYAAHNSERLKSFFVISTICCAGYGILSFILYALLGTSYYTSLFQNPAIIANGAKYWFWFGLGQIFFAVVCNVRTFFESVGRSNIALLSGIGELLGNLLCALWIIPVFGNIGRSLAHTSGYFLAMLFLLIAYFFSRKRIYRKAQ